MIDIEVALKWYLLEAINDTATTDQVRLDARTYIQTIVGRNVFFNRMPQGGRRGQDESVRAVSHVAIVIDTLTVQRNYQQLSQINDIHTFLNVEVRSRKGPAPRIAKQLLNAVRLATTGFCGYWKYLDDAADAMSEVSVEINHLKWDNETATAFSVSDGMDRWMVNRRATMDIHHNEEIPTPVS